MVQVEAAGVVGALVRGHDEAVVEGGSGRSDVVILTRERYVVDDGGEYRRGAVGLGRTKKHEKKSVCWNHPSVSTMNVWNVSARHLPLTGARRPV